MDVSVAKRLNDFFSSSLTEWDRDNAMDFVADYFCPGEVESGKWIDAHS